MSVNKLLAEYKSELELKAFAEAQFRTILELNKKLSKLEEENKELQKIVHTVTPLLPSDTLSIRLEGTDEEVIARVQLMKLNEISQDRELTLEEAKRVEIFSKILASVRNQPKIIKSETKNLKDADLLTLLVDNNEPDKA